MAENIQVKMEVDGAQNLFKMPEETVSKKPVETGDKKPAEAGDKKPTALVAITVHNYPFLSVRSGLRHCAGDYGRGVSTHGRLSATEPRHDEADER